MTDYMPISFQAAATGLRAKRRALNKELAGFLRLVKDEGLPTIEVFKEKQAQFESEWDDVVKANDNCLSLLNTDDEEEIKKVEELNEALDVVRDRKEVFEYLEEKILRKAAESAVAKNAITHEISEVSEDKTLSSIAGSEDNLTENVNSLENAQAPDIMKNPVSPDVKSEENSLSEPRKDNDGILDAI